uniref:glucuronosyltransferase n=1 Tax=Strongyloides papillosus TaxID=174720 RepID=A0A0N5BUV5_STREA
MSLKYFILFFNLFLLPHSYKILIVNPKMGYSHVNFFSQIADILTDAGHDVTVLTINLDPTIKHPGAYKAKVITFLTTEEVEKIFPNMYDNRMLWNLSSSVLDQYKLLVGFIDTRYKQSLKIFNDDELTEKIRKEKFDLGIVEAFHISILGMFKVWGIKDYVTGFSMSLTNIFYKDFGLPFPASFIPTLMSPFSDKMTYKERFQNLFVHHFSKTICYFLNDKLTLQKEFDERYGVGYYKSRNVVGDSSFIFINSNPFLDIPGPKTPKMVEVSGIGIKDPKPLDEYWSKIISLRNKTVIISFGSFAKAIHMPEDMKNGLLEVVKKNKDITFIWKYEEPEDGTGKDIENLVLSKWVPQNDLLNDERLSLFITHGEGFLRGVPAVVILVMGDQLRNARLVERQNYGIIMDKLDLANSDILIKNIETIINDETYRKNAKIVSKRLNKRPIGSKRLLIEHIEFAAEFGRLEMLDLASRNMGMIEYYNLDIILPVIIGLLILIVNPKIGYSHVNFFSQIADILTEEGHDVTVLAIDFDPSVKHPGAYKAKVIRFRAYKAKVIRFPSTEEIDDTYDTNFDNKLLWKLPRSGPEQYKLFVKMTDTTYNQTLRVFNNDELTEKMRKEKFDLGIVEAFYFSILGMFKVWGIKAYVTGFSMSLADNIYNDFGLPFTGSFIPNHMSPFSDKMTYKERFQNVFSHYVGEAVLSYLNNKMTLQKEFDEKYGKGFFNGNNAVGDSSFIVINSNPFLDIPGPKTPKMVEVSGIGIKDPKPLKEYWNGILSLKSKTILISFGTYVKSIYMPEDMKNGLLEVIKKMKDITFIWKYEEPEDGTGKDIENLVLSKWVPQNDLLNDERLSLFITHGGMGSITELSFRGVPAVIIPILGDQYRNAKLVERQNYGIIMDKLDLTNSSILMRNIKTLLNDETYKNNAKVVSKRLNKRPIGSKRLLIEHIEFAAEFGRLDMLDLASRNMGMIEYYNLDIIIPVITGFFLFVLLLSCVIVKIAKKSFIVKYKTD